jgi:hypothetical protein
VDRDGFKNAMALWKLAHPERKMERKNEEGDMSSCIAGCSALRL